MRYTVLKPTPIPGKGPLEKGATVDLHPRQAVFLVASGHLQAQTAEAEKAPAKKPTKPE